MITVSLAHSKGDISKCFPVMVQLRSSFSLHSFVKQVKRQQAFGYKLAFVEDQKKIVAVAGFRVTECLSWGKFLYIDDLITDGNNRSKRYGDKIFDFLVDYAKKEGCQELHLDSGVQRFAAHRFYLRKRMEITCHHFCLLLKITV